MITLKSPPFELSLQIVNMIQGNAGISICLDNAHLAADDFKLKLDYEMGMRQTVDADVSRLRKMLDDTNVVRLHLESDIESFKEELITLRKYHKADMAELRAQIIQTSVQVDIDAPKGQDLTKVMEEMRAKYERIALKNQEELKAWHESQVGPCEVLTTLPLQVLSGPMQRHYLKYFEAGLTVCCVAFVSCAVVVEGVVTCGTVNTQNL